MFFFGGGAGLPTEAAAGTKRGATILNDELERETVNKEEGNYNKHLIFSQWILSQGRVCIIATTL